MKKLCNKIIVLLMIVLVMLPIPAGATASIVDINSADEVTITPFAIQLVVCYTYLDGIKYRRRWNATYGEWYDWCWVPMDCPFPGPK